MPPSPAPSVSVVTFPVGFQAVPSPGPRPPHPALAQVTAGGAGGAGGAGPEHLPCNAMRISPCHPHQKPQDSLFLARGSQKRKRRFRLGCCPRSRAGRSQPARAVCPCPCSSHRAGPVPAGPWACPVLSLPLGDTVCLAGGDTASPPGSSRWEGVRGFNMDCKPQQLMPLPGDPEPPGAPLSVGVLIRQMGGRVRAPVMVSAKAGGRGRR